MKYLDNYSLDELKNLIEDLGLKSYRANQIFSYIHKNHVKSILDISVLKKDLREKLNRDYALTDISILRELISKDNSTKKYLLRLPDGEIVEAVYMSYDDRDSICISSQVGCNMGCVFCASTKGGKARDLIASEMLRQIYLLEDQNDRIDNIVVMGQGEPLDNFDNLVKFLEIISSELGDNKSLRKITVSTCGIPDKIRKLAEYNFPITLALSLHRTTDSERSKLMPINRAYNLEEVIDSLKYYYNKTNRRITFEYMVIGGENDSYEDAKRIKKMTELFNAHVNILELNPIEEFKNTGKKNGARCFLSLLNDIGVNATLRNSRGKDIEGACGQLRRKYKEGITTDESIRKE